MSRPKLDWRPDSPWGDDSSLAAEDSLSNEKIRKVLGVGVAIGLGLLIGLIAWRAFDAGDGGLAWLALGGVALGVLAVVLKNFEFGVTGFLWIGWLALKTPAVAQGQSGGGAQGLQIAHAGLAALIGLTVLRSFFGVKLPTFRHALWWPSILHLIFCGLSTTAGILFPDSDVAHFTSLTNRAVNIMDWLTRFLSLGGVMVAGAVLHGKWIDRASLGLVVTCVVSFFVSLANLPHPLYIEFANIMAMSVMGAAVLLGVGKPWLRWGMAALVLGMLGRFLLGGTEWVSGWAAALLAIAIVAYVAQRKLFMISAGLLFCLVAVNAPYFYEKVYLSNFYAGRDLAQRGAEGETFENDRSRMLLAAVRFAEEFPLGIGLGNYKAYNSYYGRKEVWNTTVFTSAHGSYAQILSEAGWPGLITMLWLLVASGRVMFLYYKRGAHVAPWRRAFLLGTYGGAVGNFCAAFLGDYLFPTYHNGGMGSFGATIYTWMFLGVGLAIGREDRLEPANDPPARYIPKSPVIHRRVEGATR